MILLTISQPVRRVPQEFYGIINGKESLTRSSYSLSLKTQSYHKIGEDAALNSTDSSF